MSSLINKMHINIQNKSRNISINDITIQQKIKMIKNKVRMNSNKVFYVCSYGGCGSKMLCEYLGYFGTVKHIHSRCPPDKLTHITTYPNYDEWFGKIPISEKDIANYYVIYIYRDPIKAIQSRFDMKQHLIHIQCNPSITLEDVVKTKKDLYGIETFFDNYTTRNINRNYKIYCVKYEDLFENIEELNRVLNIRCDKSMYPTKTVREKPELPEKNDLENIYSNLKQKMERRPFISIV
jgi:hypothetical protein